MNKETEFLLLLEWAGKARGLEDKPLRNLMLRAVDVEVPEGLSPAKAAMAVVTAVANRKKQPEWFAKKAVEEPPTAEPGHTVEMVELFVGGYRAWFPRSRVVRKVRWKKYDITRLQARYSQEQLATHAGEGVMDIQLGDAIYRYEAVPLSLVLEFHTAESPGAFYTSRIKGKFPRGTFCNDREALEGWPLDKVKVS